MVLKKPGQFALVDNRTWDEFIGKSSGYSYHEKKGRVPGAIFGYAGKKNSYSMEYYRNLDNTMRNAGEILDLWQGQVLIPTNTCLLCVAVAGVWQKFILMLM